MEILNQTGGQVITSWSGHTTGRPKSDACLGRKVGLPNAASFGSEVMNSISVVLASMLLVVTVATKASALTITNGTEHSLKVTAEKWQRRINPGDSAVFTPTNPPVLLHLEIPDFYIPCEADTNDEVKVEGNQCYVNGEAAGDGQVRM